MQRTRTLLVWSASATLVILLARTVAYALRPNPAARVLEQRAGGPAFPTVVLATLALGAALAVVVCWLAALGVRERALLERRTLATPLPRIRVHRVLACALVLGTVTSLLGGLVEAYVHWRAGMGWHGLHCIFGPVHRDLIPIESALSLVAAAVVESARHVGLWMRRTFALLRALPASAVSFTQPLAPAARQFPRRNPQLTAGSPRAPPALS
jgi:hypothetical protein